MIYIFLIILIAAIAVPAWMLFIPNKIRPLAKNAGFKTFSHRYRLMVLQNIPVEELLNLYIKAKEVNVLLDFDDL